MSVINRSEIEALLKNVIDPNMDKDPVTANCIKDIRITGHKVEVDVVLGYPAKSWLAAYRKMIISQISGMDGVTEAEVTVEVKIDGHTAQKGVSPIEGVKNIIAVASGKGGVGKSTVAVNLALALAAEGARAGILDADIYGPSQPRMLGISGRPESVDGKSLEPMNAYHVQSMSIGYLIEEETPMIWRGPMVTQALEQLLRDTHWQDLDYLIIDLPPGTGDIQLTLAQKVPVTGAIIVTTPQDIALLDARKALKMFEKVEIPVLGVIENMSTHICSQCGHEEHIFGEGGGARMAEDYAIEQLGGIPLDRSIRQAVDEGKPSVVSDPDGSVARTYKRIARRSAAKLATRKKEYSAAFPSIMINNS